MCTEQIRSICFIRTIRNLAVITLRGERGSGGRDLDVGGSLARAALPPLCTPRSLAAPE